MNANVNAVDCDTKQNDCFPIVPHVRTHSFRADAGQDSGSSDSTPSPHDYFDAATAACKALTGTWYAKRQAIPLEHVESHVERDDSEERKDKYRLRVSVEFQGSMSEAQHDALTRAVAACPIHKLMTRTEVEIQTMT